MVGKVISSIDHWWVSKNLCNFEKLMGGNCKMTAWTFSIEKVGHEGRKDLEWHNKRTWGLALSWILFFKVGTAWACSPCWD